MTRNLQRQPNDSADVAAQVRTEADLAALFPAPRTPLVEAALRARREHLRAGGRTRSLDEINAAVAEARGGSDADE